MRAPWIIVARREMVAKLTDKTFIASTLVILGIMAASVGVQAWLENRQTTAVVTVTPEAASMGTAAAAPTSARGDDRLTVTIEPVADAAAAAARLRDESADAWLHRQGDAWTLTSLDGVGDALTTRVADTVRAQVLAERAADAGTTLADLQRGSDLQSAQLEGSARNSAVAQVVGLAFAILFYIASLTFGLQLAGSVVEEKQSRVVEIIAASIPLRQLLAGKVIGITLLALGQIVLFAGVGLILLRFTSYADVLPSISGPIAWFVAFFLAGFLAIATLWAVAGALASRTEDVQATSLPLTMLTVAVLFAGLSLSGGAQAIGSFVPPLSAVVMPVRLVGGDVPFWQPVLSLVLLAGFAVAVVLASERIYRRSLLQTQGRVSLRQAWTTPD